MEQKRESNVCHMVRSFRYKGVEVFIRRWYRGAYEFMVAIDGKIYTDYYELAYTKKKDDWEMLVNAAIDYLQSAAVKTIDYHKRSILTKLKENLTNNIKRYEHYFRKWGFKPQTEATPEHGH